MHGEIEKTSDLFFQEFEFAGVAAPAIVWGAALLLGLGFVGTVLWIQQYNKQENV